MTIRSWLGMMVVLASLAVLLEGGSRAAAEDDMLPPHRVGRSVPLQTLPQVVRDTICTEGGPDITTVIKRTDATGATVYETPILDHDGLHQRLVVGEDGSVLSKLPIYRRERHHPVEAAPATDH